MKDKLYIPVVLLVIAAFLIPIAGGYVSTDSLSLEPGANAFLAALFGGASIPLLSHALIALPILGALVWVLAERQVQQVPNQKITLAVFLLLVVITVSVGFSSFKGASVPAMLEWLTYGATLFAVVAAAGRRHGPLAILTALFVGCVVVAMKGIVEYGQAGERSWRIFGGWMGPNALAAMLLIGLFVGLGIMLGEARLKALLAGIGISVIGFALILTQSKGGLLAFGISLFLFATITILWTRERFKVGLARIAAVLAVIAIFATMLQLAQKAESRSGAQAQSASSGPSPLARFTNASESQEQSVEFRRLLWKGAWEIWKETPTGVGVGAYRFASAKPGLTTQTALTHQTYLQLLAESSIVAPLILIGLLALWTYCLFRGARGVPAEQRLLRAGIFAAVVAVAMHALIDSDLQYYGIGVAFFMLLGVGLLLSTDAVAPEYIPREVRSTGIGATVLVTVLMFYCAWIEVTKSAERGAEMAGDLSGATALLGSLESAAPWDGEVWYLAGRLARSDRERLENWQKAADLAPSTRNLRALARAQAQGGDSKTAVATLLRSLQSDPNNLLSLRQILSLFVAQGDSTSAANTAKRLLAVESSPYFKVRSEPQIVPLETAEARLYLAQQAALPEKADLLAGAVKLYADYTSRTIWSLLQFAKVDPKANYGGEDIAGATRHMNDAKQAAVELEKTYRAMSEPSKADEARQAAQGFDDALAKLAEAGRK